MRVFSELEGFGQRLTGVAHFIQGLTVEWSKLSEINHVLETRPTKDDFNKLVTLLQNATNEGARLDREGCSDGSWLGM